VVKYFLIILLLMASTALGGAHASNDSCPSINTFLVGNIYNAENVTLANARWFSTHNEFILNSCLHDDEISVGEPGRLDSIYLADPTTEPTVYTNLSSLGNRSDGDHVGWEYRAHMAKSDSINGAAWNADSNFVHFSDSVIVQQLDGPEQRTINAYSLSDSAKRVSLRGWYNDASDFGASGSGYYPAGDGDWFCNITSPTYMTLRAVSMAFIFTKQDSIWGSTDATVNYNYVDNYILDWGECTPGYWYNDTTKGSSVGRKIISSASHNGGVTTTVRDSLDWDIANSIGPNDASVLRTPMWDIAEEYQDSMVAAGFGGGIFNVINSGTTNLGNFCAQVIPGGLFYENRGKLFVSEPYADGWVLYLAKHDAAQTNSPTSKQFWEYRWAGTVYDTTTANADRIFLASMASFMCFQDTLIDHFHFGKADTDYWFKGHEVSIGLPEAAMIDSIIPETTEHVMFREYTLGLVLFRPKMASGSDTTAADAITINLGGSMWRIDHNLDSTLVTSVDIRAQEGIILGDVSGVDTDSLVINDVSLMGVSIQ